MEFNESGVKTAGLALPDQITWSAERPHPGGTRLAAQQRCLKAQCHVMIQSDNAGKLMSDETSVFYT